MSGGGGAGAGAAGHRWTEWWSSMAAAMGLGTPRQVKKMFNNAKTTTLCGFITILVLRGTIGFNGGSGTTISPRDAAAGLSVVTGNTTSFFSFDPKVTNWDDRRRQWLRDNPGFPSTTATGRPRILLVTGSPPGPCDAQHGDRYILRSIKNKLDYCRIHGLELFHSTAILDDRFDTYWAKIPLLRRLMLSHPEFEWLWWMDHDAFFTDIDFKLPIASYDDNNDGGGVNMVVPGYRHLVFEQRSWVGINMGSYLVRNTQWALDMFDAWAAMGVKGAPRREAGEMLTELLPGRPSGFDADDQSAFVYLLLAPELDSGARRWEEKVYIENSYDLHGYWVGLVDKYERMTEEGRLPFVTHFVGCKTCGRYADYAVGRCLSGMERALNVADDQLMRRYGFRHANWSSSEMVSLPPAPLPPEKKLDG